MCSYGQTLDSLHALLKTKPNAEVYYEIGKHHWQHGSDSALHYLSLAEQHFLKDEISILQGKNYELLGRALVAEGKVAKAQEAYKLGLQIGREFDDISLQENLSHHLVEHIYLPYNQFENAFQVANALRDAAIQRSDSSALFEANALLYSVYFLSQTDYETQAKLSEENLVIAEKLNDPEKLISAYFDQAIALNRARKHREALRFYDKVQDIEGVLDNDDLMSRIMNNIGTIYFSLRITDSAAMAYTKAYEHSENAGRIEGMAASELKMGNLEGAMGNFQEAYMRCSRALHLFRDANILRRQDACLSCMTEASALMDKHAQALEHYREFVAVKDSLDSSGKSAELKRLRNEHELRAAHIADSIKFAQLKQLQDAEITAKNALLERKEAEQERNALIRWGLIGIVVVLLALGYYIYIKYKQTQKQKQLLNEAYEELEEKNTEITDSIQYAKRIQTAILPEDKIVKQYLAESFVLYLPKDIVAGDFYWMHPTSEEEVLFAVCDCTGHGVPGAMVSVVCNSGLNRAVDEYNCQTPAEILDKTRQLVVAEFSKSTEKENIKDGMDVALCRFNSEEKSIQFAGANNPLWIVRNGEVIIVKGDKQSIGYSDNTTPFTNHKIQLQKGDSFYLFSDGYPDQFGGSRGKKLKSSGFKELLLNIQGAPMEEQRAQLNSYLKEWRGNYEQLDDVCVIGVRI